MINAIKAEAAKINLRHLIINWSQVGIDICVITCYNPSVNLQSLADTIYQERKDLIEKYPGRWTITTDLLLLPERMDYENPNHAFGFDSENTYRTVQDKIRIGLQLIANEYGTEGFMHSSIRLKVEHHSNELQNQSQVEVFHRTKMGHDLRAGLGRHFLN